MFRHFKRIFKALSIHEEAGIICYMEPEDEPINNVIAKYKIIIPLSLIIPVFNNAHYGSLQGHHGIGKTRLCNKTELLFSRIISMGVNTCTRLPGLPKA